MNYSTLKYFKRVESYCLAKMLPFAFCIKLHIIYKT